MHVTDQVLSIYAGTRGHLDKVPLKDVHAWEERLPEVRPRAEARPLAEDHRQPKQLDDDAAAAVDQAIAEFQNDIRINEKKVREVLKTLHRMRRVANMQIGRTDHAGHISVFRDHCSHVLHG